MKLLLRLFKKQSTKPILSPEEMNYVSEADKRYKGNWVKLEKGTLLPKGGKLSHSVVNLDGKHYAIISIHKEGTTGKVKKVYNIYTGEKVALKILRNPHPLLKNEKLNLAAMEQLVGSATRTIKKEYLGIKFIEGKPIYKIDFSTTSLHQKKELALQLLQQLKNMHQKKILHRDISHNNILVSKSKSTAKFCDLGVSVQSEDLSAAEAISVGTAIHHAPEINAKTTTPPFIYTFLTDIFALGSVLKHFLFKQEVTLQENSKHKILYILDQMTAIDPKARPTLDDCIKAFTPPVKASPPLLFLQSLVNKANQQKFTPQACFLKIAEKIKIRF